MNKAHVIIRRNLSSKSNKLSMVNTRRRGRELKLLKKCSQHPPTTSSTYNFSFGFSAQSTITNKSRLKLLHKREEVLQQIFSGVREPSTPLYTQSGRYDQFLEGVITESLLHIMESTVNIHCRTSDVQQVQQAAANASVAYGNLSGFEVSCNVHGSISDNAYAFGSYLD